MKIASNHFMKKRESYKMTLRREFIVRHRNFCVHRNWGKALQIQSTFTGARIHFNIVSKEV